MKINCVWEHNGNDSILYASDFVGAFTRGASKEEAVLNRMGVKTFSEDEIPDVFGFGR